MMRRLLATLTVVALGLVLVARAEDPVKTKTDPKAKSAVKDENAVDPKVAKEEAAIRQQQLAAQYREFEAALLRLAQRLADSNKQEDRDKAVILKRALEKAGAEGTSTKFERLIKELKEAKGELNLQEIKKASDANQDLAADIRAILTILMTDNRDEELHRKILELQEMLKKLNQVIRDQQTVRAWTDRATMEKERLEREQRMVRNATEDLIKGQGKPGENKNSPTDPKAKGKPGEAKEGNKAAEAKNDTKEAKGGERNAEGKPSENKEAKPGEAKEGKPGENKEGKPGEAKEGKPGENKESKPGEAKSGQQSGKPSESKEGKPGESKDGGKPQGAQENKPGEAKENAKPSENKEQKPGEAKEPSKEQKPGEPKKEQGENKGKQDQKGEAKGQQGKPSPGQPQQGQPKSGDQKQQQQASGKGDPQQQQQQQAQNDPAKKKIQEGVEGQKESENDIKKNELPKAGEKQEKVIQDLKDAAKKLEELLKQLRQEEIERILAALQGRCERMLAMQIEVRDGTVEVQKTIDKLANMKPTATEAHKANGLSDREGEIVDLASKAIELLKNEGSAVAFPEVFMQIRDDMITVANRLRKTDTALVTQTIENDIIDTLKEMIEALKKARQENQQQQQKPQPPQQGQPPQGDQKLVELLHELKMIRSMQVRVNDRTKLYGKEYQGEQAPAAGQTKTPAEREKADMIQKELKGLSERQMKIFDVTNNIARGKNK